MSVPEIDNEVIEAIAMGRCYSIHDALGLENRRLRESICVLKAAVVALDDRLQNLSRCVNGQNYPIGNVPVGNFEERLMAIEVALTSQPAQTRKANKNKGSGKPAPKVCSCGENEACSFCP